MPRLAAVTDFTRFFGDETFYHKVEVCVGEQRLPCSGVILAVHSSVLERKIKEENGCIMLDEMVGLGKQDQQIECLKYLYGADVKLSLKNIETVVKFASVYEVESLYSLCLQWISCRYLSFFYKICSQLSGQYKARLHTACEFFISKNCKKVGEEMEDCIVQGSELDVTLLMMALRFVPKNGHTILSEWTSKSTENKEFILHNGSTLNFNRLYPKLEDFTAFINSELSIDSTSVEIMKLVVELQQAYFMQTTTEVAGISQQDTPRPDEQQSESGSDCESDIGSHTSSIVSTQSKQKTRMPRNKNKRNTNRQKSGTDNKSSQNDPGGKNDNNKNQSKAPNKGKDGVFVKSQEANRKAPNAKVSNPGDCTVYLGNVQENSSAEDIRNLFGFVGEITRVDVISGKNCAFLVFKREQSAKKLLKNASGGKKYLLKGNHLVIAEYKPKINKS